MAHLSALVVGENETYRKMLVKQLERWDIKASDASSADEALTICNSRYQQNNHNFFDVAFIDVHMSSVSGRELARKLKSDDHFRSMKLILMHTINDSINTADYADIGFIGYFSKPIPIADLHKSLTMISANKHDDSNETPLLSHSYLRSLVHSTTTEINTSIIWPNDTRILLVDDNQINLEVALAILEDAGLEVDCALNGAEALRSISQAQNSIPYRLVLMDCQMPEMDGFTATHKIRNGEVGEQSKNLLIIAMTAYAMTNDMQKCLDAGMDDYLSKPVDADKLIHTLDKWINGNELTDNNSSVVNKAVTVWDRDELLKRLRGREDRLTKFVNMYLDSETEYIEQLQQAILEQDNEAIHRHAHSFKGVAANLSAIKLQQKAADLEAAANQNLISEYAGLLQAVVSASHEFSN